MKEDRIIIKHLSVKTREYFNKYEEEPQSAILECIYRNGLYIRDKWC